MKRTFLLNWVLVVFLTASVLLFAVCWLIPWWQTYSSVGQSAEAINFLRCVGRKPNCLSTEWLDRVAIQKKCGLPCLGLGEMYEYKFLELDGKPYVVARFKIEPGSLAGSIDSWFFGLNSESTEPFQCRDKTATAGVFRRNSYAPDHPVCLRL